MQLVDVVILQIVMPIFWFQTGNNSIDPTLTEKWTNQCGSTLNSHPRPEALRRGEQESPP